MTDTRKVTVYPSDGFKELVAARLSDPTDYHIDFDADDDNAWVNLDVYRTFNMMDGYGEDFRSYRLDMTQFAAFLAGELEESDLTRLK